jgi:glycosyltransferase involved in cell wall biosynthesis
MAVRRALLRARPALVHSNTLKCHLMAGLAARACRLPVVWHMRDIVPEPGAWAMLARVARMVRPRVIAISEADARHVRPLGLPITVVHNGVPLDDFAPGEPSPALRAELGLRPEHRVLMVVSRLTPWKGHRQLLEAMPAVLERFTDARLVVVGTTAFWDDAYADELRTLAGRLGLADAVVWTGHRKDVPDLLRLCEVFVLPSRDEPFGRAIVEAMATGKPVVAGRAGGVPEICPDGECGHLVDPEDAAGIAEALVALLAEPDRAREMGLAGLARAREHFDARVTAEKVQSVYEEVLAGGA